MFFNVVKSYIFDDEGRSRGGLFKTVGMNIIQLRSQNVSYHGALTFDINSYGIFLGIYLILTFFILILLYVKIVT